MAQIKLEKYVEGLANTLVTKYGEYNAMMYIAELSKHSASFPYLTNTVVDVICQKNWNKRSVISDDDFLAANRSDFNVLYKKAFRTAFPDAWKTLTEIDKRRRQGDMVVLTLTCD